MALSGLFLNQVEYILGEGMKSFIESKSENDAFLTQIGIPPSRDTHAMQYIATCNSIIASNFLRTYGRDLSGKEMEELRSIYRRHVQEFLRNYDTLR